MFRYHGLEDLQLRDETGRIWKRWLYVLFVFRHHVRVGVDYDLSRSSRKACGAGVSGAVADGASRFVKYSSNRTCCMCTPRNLLLQRRNHKEERR